MAGRDMRQVSFRMHAGVYADYVAFAASRGVDLSALLNWVVTEYRPALLLSRAENDAGMLRAAALGLSSPAALGIDPREALDRLNELIRSLQESAANLSLLTGGAAHKAA